MRYLAAFPVLLLTACSLAPDAIIPTDRIPESWLHGTEQAKETKDAKPAQWSDLGSEELNALITKALANNTDVAAALARVEQARAAAKISGAGLYPQIDASGSVGKTRSSSNGVIIRRDSSDVGLNVSYELDLWQKNRNTLDSSLWQLKATEFDKSALTLLVSSEVARLYTGLLALDARMSVAKKNLANAQEVLRVTELRHKEGAISGLELAQQRTAVNNTQASIDSLKNQRELFFNQLAQMTGVAPSQLTIAATSSLDQIKEGDVALASPWQLLERRPDIGAAEARLRAANIDIGVARANALPSLSASLNGSLSGNPSSNLVGIAASFFAPIFQGGALEGAIERSTAARDEQVASYQGVLLASFREVEDALANYEAAVARRKSLSVAAEEARKANTIANTQFREGSIDFTTLITTQNSLLQAEDSHLSAIQAQLAARIDLMRALGGPV